MAFPLRRPPPSMRTPGNIPGIVVVYSCKPSKCKHEQATQAELAKRLAAIRGDEFGGHYEAKTAAVHDRPVYFVPDDTLPAAEAARELGIRGEQDLFGGVVPYPFVGTKSITHALPPDAACMPPGWSRDFARRVRDAVLPGYSVFSRRDALHAGLKMLARGSLRLKKPSGVGGLGQSVVACREQLEEALDMLDAQELSQTGLVLERNLTALRTRSVGQVRMGSLRATYCGTQKLTADNNGTEVYGGSDLLIVRGDFDDLLRLPLEPQVHTAIAQARAYHAAALACYPGMFASRCNYDIAQGVDEEGHWHSGVLEQSWRIGGASGAEVAALEAFRDDPALSVVRASTTEIYGGHPALPPGAALYFQGDDDRVGPIMKFARLEAYGNP